MGGVLLSFFCFSRAFLTSARQEVRVPVQPAHYGPRRLGVGGTASCSTSSSGGSWAPQAVHQQRTALRAAWQQVCFAKPRSRNPTSGAANPAWPRGAGRQERAGLGGARVECPGETTQNSIARQLRLRGRICVVVLVAAAQGKLHAYASFSLHTLLATTPEVLAPVPVSGLLVQEGHYSVTV